MGLGVRGWSSTGRGEKGRRLWAAVILIMMRRLCHGRPIAGRLRISRAGAVLCCAALLVARLQYTEQSVCSHQYCTVAPTPCGVRIAGASGHHTAHSTPGPGIRARRG